MSDANTPLHPGDIAPGDRRPDDFADGHAPNADLRLYLIGLGLASLLTIVSFFIAGTTLVWAPSIPIALFVLAAAQMGVHLVFFLHLTTGADNVNNALALAFGVLIVALLIGGSLWIMGHLDQNMMPMSAIMKMQ